MRLEEVINPDLFSFIIAALGGGILSWIILKNIILKKIRFELEQEKKNLEFALTSGKIGTWDIDLQTDKVTCSSEMLKLWNITLPMNGKRSVLQSKVHPDDIEMMRERIDIAIANGGIYECEYRIFPTPDNMRWVRSLGRITYSQDHKPVRFSGVVYDITEKKIREEVQAQITKTREQFYMIAGHELKTPLTCLHLQLQVQEWELVNNFQNGQVTLQSGLKKQHQHLKRITRIVDNMLDRTKILESNLTLNKETVQLKDMILDVVEQVRLAAERSQSEIILNVNMDIKGEWDRFRLEQVLLNLLINAMRYGNRKPITISLFQENEEAVVSVKDHGAGIKKSDHERIFEKFERGDQVEVSGMGLGLFISKNIVIAHGGRIDLISDEGQGAEFRVILPLR